MQIHEMYRYLIQRDINFVTSIKLIVTMTFVELQRTLNKAVLRLGVGMIVGYCIAAMFMLSHTIIFAIATGLLCSLHLICRWVMALVEEYKRLKSQENENENILAVHELYTAIPHIVHYSTG